MVTFFEGRGESIGGVTFETLASKGSAIHPVMSRLEKITTMCPECGEPLVRFELDGIEIDHCVVCVGTWLATDQIEILK